MLTIRDETFEGTFPFAPHYYSSSGFDMHYVDEGSGEPVVMVHGDPTWSYLYRNFIPPLSRHYRCVVPDQMGMGKSAVPQDRERYRLEQHRVNLEALLLHLPWPGGPFPRLLALIRSERGEAFVLQKNGYLEPALLGTTHHSEKLTKTVMEAYRAPFPTPESRLAMLCWSRDIPVQETDVSYTEMKRIEQGLAQFDGIPILLVWGMQDPVLSASVLHRWQQVYPRAITYELEDASHFLQEDAPGRIVKRIETFLEASP